MDFEGLTIDGPEDVVRHYRSKTQTRPRDDFYWAWISRFAASSPAARAMVGEAIALLVAEEGGDELRPTTELGQIMLIGEHAGVHTQLDPLRRRLMDDLTGLPDDEVETLLSWIIGAKPHAAPTPLSDAELARVAALAARPGCFHPALALISRGAPPWQLPPFVAAHAEAAWQRGERFVRRLATEWRLQPFAPYRLELLRALAGAPEELRTALRDAIVSRRSSEELEQLVESGWSDDPDESTAPYARATARLFAGAGPTTLRVLLVHPRDAQDLDLGPSFRAYAEKVEANADAFAADKQPRTVLAVGDPRPLEPDGPEPGAPMCAVWVPVTVESPAGPETDEILVYRLGDRFKIGPLVAADEENAGPSGDQAPPSSDGG
jgi:hypothetical protein